MMSALKAASSQACVDKALALLMKLALFVVYQKRALEPNPSHHQRLPAHAHEVFSGGDVIRVTSPPPARA